jgi:hypothetical protein
MVHFARRTGLTIWPALPDKFFVKRKAQSVMIFGKRPFTHHVSRFTLYGFCFVLHSKPPPLFVPGAGAYPPPGTGAAP